MPIESDIKYALEELLGLADAVDDADQDEHEEDIKNAAAMIPASIAGIDLRPIRGPLQL